MKGTIFLHLGVHKTGTTSLQRLIGACHDALLARGICELSVHSPVHEAYREFRLPFTRMRDRILYNPAEARDDALKAATETAREAFLGLCSRIDEQVLVISDENMLGPPIGQLRSQGFWESRFYPKAAEIARAAATIFDGFDVVPILCRRDAAGLVESLYGNSIQGLSFAGDLSEFLDRIALDTIDFARLDRAVETAFGKPVAWLDFALIKESEGGSLARAFFDLIGAGDLVIPQIEQSNSRYNDRQVRVARMFAAEEPSGEDRARLARYVRRMPAPEEPSFSETSLTDAQRDEIARRAAD